MRMFRNAASGSVAVAAVLLLFTVMAVPVSQARKELLGEGEGVFKTVNLEALETFTFDYDLTEEERSYLGITSPGPFTVKDVGADLLILELLNTYCYACVQQAPIINRLHERIEEREDLRDRVRFLGVAVGNGQKEVDTFKGQFDIAYPLVPDPEFKTFDAVINIGGTPFIALYPLRSGALPRGHLGVMRDLDAFVAAIEEALAAGPSEGAAPEFKLTDWRNLSPDMTAGELEKKIRESASEIGFAAGKIEAVEVEGEKNIFRLSGGEGRGLWAKVAGRAKICNICHDIFFILLFDDDGKIVNFTPIHVTKYENVPIDDKDTAFMKQRVIGRYVTEPVTFDSEVDAISQATMSSELIFDTIRRLGGAYGEMPK